MLISVSGCQNIGKTTFCKDFIKQWPMYTTPTERYTNLVKEGKVKLNKEGSEESQLAVLNHLCDQVINQPKDVNVILDRGVLDNLIYTLHLNHNKKVSDKFVQKTIDIVKNTLIFYDLIFFLPITKYSPVNIEEAPNRNIDPVYRDEVDVLFKALMNRYVKHDIVYFPFDHEKGCPGIVEIFGNREQRIQVAKMYIDTDGQLYDASKSLITSEDEDPETQKIAEQLKLIR